MSQVIMGSGTGGPTGSRGNLDPNVYYDENGQPVVINPEDALPLVDTPSQQAGGKGAKKGPQKDKKYDKHPTQMDVEGVAARVNPEKGDHGFCKVSSGDDLNVTVTHSDAGKLIAKKAEPNSDAKRLNSRVRCWILRLIIPG